MTVSRDSTFGFHLAIVAIILVVACGSTPTRAAEIDPDADRILRQMSDHLTGVQAISFATEVSTDIILQNGQMVQFVAAGSGVFNRERGFHFRRQGTDAEMELTFDGKNLTLFSGALNGYHSIQIEGGNDAALDEVRSAFGIEAVGGADLLYANPYEGLLYEVESGDYLGETWVGDVRAHHLAYRAKEIDWQLWVRAEGDPIPLRYVITSKWITGAPQFTMQVREWNGTVIVSEADVTFSAPEGAREVDAVEFGALGDVTKE
jgi:hypothetical protein